MPRSLRTSAPLALALALILVTPGTSMATSENVTISEFEFDPASVAGPMGLTVIWTNEGSIAHTTTQDAVNPNGSPGLELWDSGNLAPAPVSGQFQFDLLWAGTYPYHCERHPPEMRGRVRIPVRIEDVSTPEQVRFRVVWAIDAAPEPLLFDVQVKRPGAGEVFNDWRPATDRRFGILRPKREGTFSFRARLIETGGGLITGSTPYSPPRSVNVDLPTP